MKTPLVALLSALLALASWAEESPTPTLPSPRMEGGAPLMQALMNRRSMRSFADRPLPEQVLSDLLWSACGVNRKATGMRTAPSAVNWQEIDVYVVRADGAYLYEARPHRLTRVSSEDLRAKCGTQGFVPTAPVCLVYAADYAKMKGSKEEERTLYSATDTGFISQNVYLFCSSEGLNTVVLGMVDRAALSQALGLRPDQKIILTQPVGYPYKPLP